ncbi:S9 family peptidase [Puniceicoccales bacterium CK1056]|uniref:S9 family peptidase n=1 Tax=Oceanipulchritudo coccoides TaxID=2706888 RepID=A0A6B2M150_9BACT|nr:prolyl oligopeptidase family serine peptidase [Oceanipulchritudo coccoides]NDV62132.1 S9 family peptidase [Oceanipulchritudo coccoides]
MILKKLFPLLVLLLGSVALHAEDLPVEYFFKDPTFRSVKLSPDGTHIAVLVRYNDIMNLAVIELATNKPEIITLEKQDISRYYWINNDRLIYMTDKVTDTKLERTGGIFAVNKNGKKGRVLVVPPGGDDTKANYNVAIPQYIGPDPDSEKRILLSIGKRSRTHPDIYSMDINNGREKRVVLNTVNARYFTTDINDNVRFGFETELVGKTTVHFLHPETDKWEVLTELPETDADWLPLDFSPDRDTFLVQTNLDRDRTVILRFNWKDLTSELVYEDPEFDVNVDNLITEIKKQDRGVGIVYEAEKPKAVYFDEQHKKLQAMIDSALPNTFNEILQTDEQGGKLLIVSSSDRIMPTYYLLDLNGFKLSELTNIAPWLDPSKASRKLPISFTASDGETVHGYLTLPLDFQAGNPVPLILNPHGGPWARDTWRLQWYFDNEPQFYANRGFAVLQVNFRGSTGFGSKFFNDHKQNIERMYLDTIEAAQWAIDQGYAHPDRVGIAGASWGGYKTMLCLVKSPDLIKFGINLFGVVDLNEAILTYLQWNREEAYDYWSEKFYDPKDPEGKAYLREWSPITHIDDIKGPVFIYHGVRDYNVDIEQSRMLVNALDRLHHPYTKVFDADEMHSLENPELRIRVYSEIDSFLMPFRKKWGLID